MNIKSLSPPKELSLIKTKETTAVHVEVVHRFPKEVVRGPVSHLRKLPCQKRN